ncbi:hypothetical protein ACTXT7_001146 [Hymenolepis weldensis]
MSQLVNIRMSAVACQARPTCQTRKHSQVSDFCGQIFRRQRLPRQAVMTQSAGVNWDRRKLEVASVEADGPHV